jgi:hypothetical protein
MHTTLNKIREKEPSAPGWAKLLKGLNKTEADDEALSIIQIIDSNGIEFAIRCLYAVEGHDKEIRLFAVDCARDVQYLMTDPRSIAALDVAERFANGEATVEELNAAKAAALGAAYACAMGAANGESRDSAGTAAMAAENAAKGDAAWAAILAASSAAMAAASDSNSGAALGNAMSARAATRAAQEKRLREICGSTIQDQE